MAEISREEAINFLKAHSECEKKKVKAIYGECNVDLCDNCDLCYAQGNWGEHIKATDKAISDMEKLQKIEKELFHWEDWILAESPNGYRDAIEYSSDDMQRMICRTIRECSNAIEQIVKEVE